jgi:hypothetical protein
VGARAYDPRTARWLQRDPIDAASGDPNLYRYSLNNPTNWVDPSGTKAMVAGCGCPPNPQHSYSPAGDGDWLDNLSNFFAGWGDTLTFGATGWIRQQMGVDSVVNRESGWYRGGEWTGLAHSTLMGGATGWARNAGMKGLRRPNPAFPRGTEYVEGSHWVPARYHWVPAWFRNSALNLKYMWGTEHALCDPYRYRFMRSWWKDAHRPYPPWKGLLYRTPSSIAGGAAGAAYGGTSVGVRRFVEW